MKTTAKAPLVKFVGRITEKLRGVFYEGPEAPNRLSVMVIAFADLHPKATRGEWIEFAQKHAAECYRSGYMRGLEWSERDKERGIDAVDPDQVAEEMRHGFDWEPPSTSLDLMLEEIVPDERPVERHFTDADEAAAHFAAEEARGHEPNRRFVGTGPRRR